MRDVYICDAIRTPIGRFGGGLSAVRADDLAAVPIKALMERNPSVDWNAVDEVFLGCANQAGEDNRNVARMALLLAGLPETIPGVTLNRLCASGMDAIGTAFRAIASGEMELAIAGGVESMSRAPFVMGKADAAFSRNMKLEDTTIGWRFIRISLMEKNLYGIDSMPETAENVAEQFNISRSDQDAFALRSQQRAAAAQASGRFAKEIVAVEIPQRKGPAKVVEHRTNTRAAIPRLSNYRSLARRFAKGRAASPPATRPGSTTGPAHGCWPGRSGKETRPEGPRQVVGMASAGVAPRIMGIGPVPAVRKLTERLGLAVSDFDVIELNEAFASQGLAVLRELGLADNEARVNPNGGAIALGHPLGMSGARLVLPRCINWKKTGSKKGLATMCVGVGQGLALAIERV